MHASQPRLLKSRSNDDIPNFASLIIAKSRHHDEFFQLSKPALEFLRNFKHAYTNYRLYSCRRIGIPGLAWAPSREDLSGARCRDSRQVSQEYCPSQERRIRKISPLGLCPLSISISVLRYELSLTAPRSVMLEPRTAKVGS